VVAARLLGATELLRDVGGDIGGRTRRPLQKSGAGDADLRDG
jgi:hypothetical protein